LSAAAGRGNCFARSVAAAATAAGEEETEAVMMGPCCCNHTIHFRVSIKKIALQQLAALNIVFLKDAFAPRVN